MITNNNRIAKITPYPWTPKKLPSLLSIKLLYDTPFKTIKDKAAKKNNIAVDLVRVLNCGSIDTTINEANKTTPAK